MVTKHGVRRWRNTIWRNITPVLACVFVVLAAVFALLALRPTPQGEPVLVAKTDLRSGEILSGSNAGVVLVPEAAVPEAALNGFEQTENTLSRHVDKGQVLTTGDFLAANRDIPTDHSLIHIEAPTDAGNLKEGEHVQIWGPSNACTEPDSPLEMIASHALIETVSHGTEAGFGVEPSTILEIIVKGSEVSDVLCATVQGTVHFVVAAP